MLPACLLLLWLVPRNPPQAAAKPAASAATKPAAPAAAAAKKPAPPTGPKTAAELQQDLATALHVDPLLQDQLQTGIKDRTITLDGVVHEAEHKGVATRLARAVALRDGWTDAHVVNHLEVQLPHPN